VTPPRLALTRFLLAADGLETLLADARLAALVKGGARAFTLALSAAPADAADAFRRVVTDLVPAAGRVDVRVTAEAPASLLEAHDAVLATGPGAGALVVKAWQRGLCAVNSAEQAEQVAAFTTPTRATTAPAAAVAGTRAWRASRSSSPGPSASCSATAPASTRGRSSTTRVRSRSAGARCSAPTPS
jgi:hypothetical protein